MSFELPALPYAYDALEPHIDARTMEIHHGKHHAGYTAKLNAAIEGTDLAGKSIEERVRSARRQRCGAQQRWRILQPQHVLDEHVPNGGGAPTAISAPRIRATFGSFDAFKEPFSQAAATRFGQGWAWLCVEGRQALSVLLANQDNPLMHGVGCGWVPHPGLGRLGARLLPELPEPPARLHRGVLQRGGLERHCRHAFRRGTRLIVSPCAGCEYLILVAGGTGTRMHRPVAKQFLPLGGRPVIVHTLAQVPGSPAASCTCRAGACTRACTPAWESLVVGQPVLKLGS